jgi:hypothetical protein
MAPHRLFGMVLSSAVVACSTPRPPTALFESRVAVEPLVAKLKASGGDPKKILHPRAASDLAGLESGKRYKFVVRDDGKLAIAPMPADAPGNEYVHPVLAEGRAVRTAGGLRVERDGSALRKVTVDQDSQAYCPTAGSLDAALGVLFRMGVPRAGLRVENRPPACVGAPPPPEAPARFGALMAEVGQRFERMGRAANSRRLDLALFEVEEIGEVFEEDLPKAEPPRENAGVNLPGVEQAFSQTNLPELKAALTARDMAAFKAAYARAAETCNGCHRSSGHGFIEIPTEPGQPVPRLDPLR